MANNRKISDRDIEKLHQMAKAGTADHIIAKELRVNRNTINAHLTGQIAYSRQLIKKLDLKRQLPCGEFIRLADCAAWLPGHPSYAMLHWLSKCGVIRTELRIDMHPTRRPQPCLFTSFEWLRAYCELLLPEGIWLPSADTWNFIPPDMLLPETITAENENTLGPRSWVSTQTGRLVRIRPPKAIRLSRFMAVCDESAVDPQIGPAVINRAVRCVENLGRCLL